jgi:hypothetical protein
VDFYCCNFSENEVRRRTYRRIGEEIKAMASRPSPDYLPDDLLVLVGKIAIQTAYMDYLLGILLAGLKGIAKNDMEKKVHALDTRVKIAEAENLIKTSIQEPKRRLILSILNRASSLSNDRNLVIHGIIRHKDDTLDNPIYWAFRGPYVGTDVPFSKDTLEPIYTDLGNICEELLSECIEFKYHEPEPEQTSPQS